MMQWWKTFRRQWTRRVSQRRGRRGGLMVERLEAREVLSAPDQHVFILSIDGLHQADVADPNLRADLTNIRALQQAGVTYTNASTTSPSDSFPGTLSYLTGAGPGTTGVFYDDSYSRTLLPPMAAGGGSTPGTEVQYAENIDKNSALLSGGGNFDATSIDPNQLPRDPRTGLPVYPHSFLPVNTVFDVAKQAGLHTAFSDKHPAYEIAAGASGTSIDEFYSPEINSITALYDPATGRTVDANALLAADPFADVSRYQLVDPSTDPLGPNDPNLINDTTKNLLLTERYDDLKVQALLNEIRGLNPQGTGAAAIPNLAAMNFQAVSVAEKYYLGGVVVLPNGDTAPSSVLEAAIRHTDASIGRIRAALLSTGLWRSTELIVTAKHGQTPRAGVGGLMADSTLPDLLSQKGTPVAFTVQDDVSLLYLKDQSQTNAAVQALQDFVRTGTIDVFFQGQKVTLRVNQVIDKVLSGSDLVNGGFGNPANNSTTPDIIVTLKPGYIWVGNPQKFQFKRAEHGGFSETDTHVALIVSDGGVAEDLRGTRQTAPVHTQQIAVTALEALGLDPAKLQGALMEGTKALPGLGLPQGRSVTFTEGVSRSQLLAVLYDASTTDDLTKYKVTVSWGDHRRDDDAAVVRSATDPHVLYVYDRHKYTEEGTYHGTVAVTNGAGKATTNEFTATVVDALRQKDNDSNSDD
jgi:arylsulfatase A-like enzyme